MWSIMKKRQIKISESFIRTFLIVIMYGVAFGLGYITRLGNPDLFFSFYVSEQEVYAFYRLNLKDLLDLIIIGPFFTVISFFLVKRILEDLKKYELPEKRSKLLFTIYLIAIVIFNYGNITHITMNRLNSQVPIALETEAFYYAIYFLDEIIGHLFITLGFFVILTEICYIHTLSLKNRVGTDSFSNFFMRSHLEGYITIFFGILGGIITAFSYLEGQSAFVYLLLNPICGALLFYFNYKRAALKTKNNLILIMFLLMTLTFTITVLLWGVFTGFKPVYPFFYQNSEL